MPHEQILQIILKLERHIPDEVKADIQIWPENNKEKADEGKGSEVSQRVEEENTAVIVTTTPLPLTAPVPIQPLSYPHAPYYPSNAPTVQLTPHITPPPQPPPFHTPYSYYPHYPAYPLPPGQPTPFPFYPIPTPPQNGSKPLFTSAPLVHSSNTQREAETRASSAAAKPKEQSSEDLPSYEDMIVEGLATVGGEDGMAPKALFAWIANRYPVQANFRPSASQALQKAYKRGRLEKSSTGGKYRLNPVWGGGSVSSTSSSYTSIIYHSHILCRQEGVPVDLRPALKPQLTCRHRLQ